MSHILGVSAGFHDAAISVVDHSGNILFAGHSERYSKKKNDPAIHSGLLAEVNRWEFDTVAYYERPWMHNYQQWRSGQKQYSAWTARSAVNHHIGGAFVPGAKVKCYPHHLSHAAAGFQTSPYDSAAVIVVDAIGEMDTASIYKAWYDSDGNARYKRLWRQTYPHSLGLFFSAVTQAVGLRPMEDEYVVMGMAAYGKDHADDPLQMMDYIVTDVDQFEFAENYHTGLWLPGYVQEQDKMDLAKSAQHIVNHMVLSLAKKARKLVDLDNLVLMGGVALNCVTNSLLGKHYQNIWIMPNPGDAGSSLGAAALAYGKKINWQTAFLGHNISGDYPVKDLCDQLIANKIVGVASGRAEFGPRALGNRSLLADPRGTDIKDRVNEIKRRQKFRPFAPVVLAEHANEYFKMPSGFAASPYMQAVAQVLRPDLYPAISHADNTARVQTVAKDGSGIRKLLELWYSKTGCPMLLNTSLNIRGEPMVNNRADADRFEKLYGVTVCS